MTRPVQFGAVVTGNLTSGVGSSVNARLELIEGVQQLAQQGHHIEMDPPVNDLFGITVPDEIIGDRNNPVIKFLTSFSQKFGIPLTAEGTDAELNFIKERDRWSIPWKLLLGIGAAATALFLIVRGLLSRNKKAEPSAETPASETF